MTSRVLTFGAGVLVTGLVGSAMAAVPDPSPFTWPRPVPDSAEVVLPDAPPPPRSQTTRDRAGTDIVLATQPRVSAPCADPPSRGALRRAQPPLVRATAGL